MLADNKNSLRTRNIFLQCVFSLVAYVTLASNDWQRIELHCVINKLDANECMILKMNGLPRMISICSLRSPCSGITSSSSIIQSDSKQLFVQVQWSLLRSIGSLFISSISIWCFGIVMSQMSIALFLTEAKTGQISERWTRTNTLELACKSAPCLYCLWQVWGKQSLR